MQMTRKERQLQLALEEKVARKRLVHSKHLGWLAVGMTSFALGVVGFTAVGTNQTVSASTNDKGAASQVVVPQTNTNRAWTLRPVSEIKAQFQASDKKVYDIKWGDTLSTISEALNESGFTTSVDRLAEINHIANIDLIYAGAKLYLQGSGDNATVTTKDNHGNEQTYNLNPAKPAVASPSDKAAAQAAEAGQGTSTKTRTGNTGQTATAPSQGQHDTSTSTKPGVPSKPSTPTPSKPSTDKVVTLTIKAIGPDGKVLQTGSVAAKVGFTVPISALKVAGYELADGVPAVKNVKVGENNTSVEFTYKRVAKNTNKSLTVNKDEQGNTLPAKPDLSKYHLLASSSKTTVQTLSNGDTVTTTTLTVTYHKIIRKTQNVVHNVDKNGNDLASTDGLILSKTGTIYKDVVADNGDVTTILTITNVYVKSPLEPKTATVTVKYVDTDNGDSIKPSEILTKNVGDSYKANALKIDGYTLEGDSSQSVTVSADGNTITFSYKKNADTHDTSKYIIKNVDEKGHDLGDKPDVAKYHKISESKPAKTDIQKLPNGNTVTTYTTTITYHKIVNTDKNVTKNTDESGKDLGEKPDASVYKRVSSSDKKTVVTANDGDTTTTITTTFVWHKMVNVDKSVTKNVDEAGNDLGQDISATDFHKLTTSTPVKAVTTAENGDTITSYTTTVTYHKIVRTTKHVAVNVDEQGNPLQSVDGYDLIKSSDASSDTVAANGDVTTTVTTTNVYKKAVVAPTSAKVTIIAKDTDGNVLKTSSVDDKVGDKYTANAPEIAGYDLQGANAQTVQVAAGGNTVIFTYKKRVAEPTTAKVTIVAKDTDGNVLKTNSVDVTVGESYTATAPEIVGYKLQGASKQTAQVMISGNTFTFKYTRAETFNLDQIRAYHITQVNVERNKVGNTSMLKTNPNNLLVQAAQSRAEEQAKMGKLDDHAGYRTNPYIQQYNGTLGSIEENCGFLLMSSSWTNEQISEAIVEQVIEANDGHTEAMIKHKTEEMGLGIAISGPFIYWTQEFGHEASTLHNPELNQLQFDPTLHSATPSESLRAYLLDQIVIPDNRGITQTFLPNVKPYIYIGKKVYQTQQDGEDALWEAQRDYSSLWNQFGQTYVAGIYNEHKFIGFIIVGKSSTPMSEIDLNQHADNLK